MSDYLYSPGLPIYIPGLPEQLHHIVVKLYEYGFNLRRDAEGVWTLSFPPNNTGGFQQIGFNQEDLHEGLLEILRFEETQRGVLIRYEQFDPAWGAIKYGKHRKDTTIKQGGCGPTSLAIVMQYFVRNNGSRQCTADTITPFETAAYAATHGRVSATRTRGSKGTAGDPMIKGIHDQWPDYDGVKVTLEEAMALVEEGWLIIFHCKGCKGMKSNRSPISYGGHFMVLSDFDGMRGPKRLFHVLDPARNADGAMKYITQQELKNHSLGFWWVYKISEVQPRICYSPGGS